MRRLQILCRDVCSLIQMELNDREPARAWTVALPTRSVSAGLDLKSALTSLHRVQRVLTAHEEVRITIVKLIHDEGTAGAR